MISVENVSKSFGSRALWSDLSFEVQPGELVALVGPSGCGKSTLLNCLGLLERVDSGRILVDGSDITRFSSRARRRFRRDTLGYLFQNYALIENASIDVNLDIAAKAIRGRARKREALASALERVGLGRRGEEMVHRLSGGEQQRVALARLMVKKASVILADEPTGALDGDNAAMVMDVLRHLAEDGCAVVIATHVEHVESKCDSRLTVGAAVDAPVGD